MSLASYFDLGLKALSAARLGMQIAGDNIANAATPGFTRRRIDLTAGPAFAVRGGYLDRGVDVAAIVRSTDRFLQTAYERELGTRAGSEEQLRGLRDVEALFGSLEGDGLSAAYGEFANRFAELSGQPDNIAQRRAAIDAAQSLARRIRDTWGRLERQRTIENDGVAGRVAEINQLAEALARVNNEIEGAEAGGQIESGARDRRQQIVERLSELTGGSTYVVDGGKVGFALPGGPGIVSGGSFSPLATSRDASGLIRITAGTIDVTDRQRGGELGALLAVRDDEIGARLADLDALAINLIRQTNLVTVNATDLNGDPGRALFLPTTGTGRAAVIEVAPEILNDVRLLAVSRSGAPGDGSGALDIAAIYESTQIALGGSSPALFLQDLRGGLGNRIAHSDVATAVSTELVATYEVRRQAVSGVSLDQEAVELLRYQEAYEAAARFMQVMNEVTEITLAIGR